MKSTGVRGVVTLFLLSSKTLSCGCRSNVAASSENESLFPRPTSAYFRIKKKNNDVSHTAATSKTRIATESNEMYVLDNELTLDDEPQREDNGISTVTLRTAPGNEEVHSIDDDGRALAENRTQNATIITNDGDVESSELGESESLEENTKAAPLRHSDPPQERDVAGDSIFPPQQDDNVFENRQHDQEDYDNG